MGGAWNGSTRRSRLPADWPDIRRRVLERDPVCTCPRCPRCLPAGRCSMPSTDVDHVQRGDDHRIEGLAGKCGPCHQWKSSSEGGTAAAATRSTKRPAERHPGLL